MFADNASYHSSSVGEFVGRVAIASMMNGFFAQYPDVYWETDNYRCDKDQNVLFDFKMSATHTETVEKIHRQGIEVISFTNNGLILRLDVKGI
ncbi:MAG: hypothetical protein ACI9KN_002368 [Gammaproteobacteria bacterium]|jgi:hypothetical protein